MSCCCFVSSFNCNFERVKLKFVDVEKNALFCFGVLTITLQKTYELLVSIVVTASSQIVSMINIILVGFLFCALKNMVSVSHLNITWAFTDRY